MTNPADEEEHQHPGELEYIKVAIILGAVTAAEVAVVYITQLRSLLVPLLLTMMVVKFALVVLWFMHLKFDSRLFMRIFVAGIMFALGVYAVLIVTLIRL
jgi:cytochrome c oxidase subunit 4